MIRSLTASAFLIKLAVVNMERLGTSLHSKPTGSQVLVTGRFKVPSKAALKPFARSYLDSVSEYVQIRLFWDGQID